MYMTLPADITTDEVFPFERLGCDVRMTLQGRGLWVETSRPVDSIQKLDQFLEACRKKLPDPEFDAYCRTLKPMQAIRWVQPGAFRDSAMRLAPVEALAWMLNVGLWGVAAKQIPGDLSGYLIEGFRLANTKYGVHRNPVRNAINFALVHVGGLAVRDLSGHLTAYAVEREIFDQFHPWITRASGDPASDPEPTLPPEAYHVAPFVLLTAFIQEMGPQKGLLSRSEVDPFGGRITSLNIKMAEALLYSIKILGNSKELKISSDATPSIMDYEDILARGMVELGLSLTE